MAFRTTTMLKSKMGNLVHNLSFRRWNHIARPAPIDNALSRSSESSFVLPEFDPALNNHLGTEKPISSLGGCMELMAVPKKKVSRHKRGIRNGPKALKPIPVIVRCRCCGRVKLPHFFCCSGERGTVGEQNDSTN